jgi:hypothetical protein
MKSMPEEQPLAFLLTYWQKGFVVLKVFFFTMPDPHNHDSVNFFSVTDNVLATAEV